MPIPSRDSICSAAADGFVCHVRPVSARFVHRGGYAGYWVLEYASMCLWPGLLKIRGELHVYGSQRNSSAVGGQQLASLTVRLSTSIR